ncbi:ribonuclease HII [Oceanobacillus halophilus]|uniref:Ribonuclease HII n=1 Tax=Oceanobacillus halophilus TaxID=930130 RepID=A0A495ABS5_9BACI|nr:ribonuclease HII [Oceanobacillus halophilus]RKQ37467.1 ribonuclease HII [Oceanobacillus halophilus]
MEKQSISVLKQLFTNGDINDEMMNELKHDERKGVQQLIKSYERQQQKEHILEMKFKEMCQYEQRAFDNGKQFIAGIDEAGRGPLAGPVVAAAVILPSDFKLLGLNDSKQLNEERRENYFSIIKEKAISYGIAIIDSQKIDEINIFEATKLAMRQAIETLETHPDHLLIDAVNLTDLPCSSESIIKGDARSISIAAASILAKVTRDRLMKEIHIEYPEYDFASNMGYGTKHHIEKLAEFGVTPYHRKTFAPVRNIVLDKGVTATE